MTFRHDRPTTSSLGLKATMSFRQLRISHVPQSTYIVEVYHYVILYEGKERVDQGNKILMAIFCNDLCALFHKKGSKSARFVQSLNKQ